MIRLTKKGVSHVLFKVIDTSGQYIHLALISLDELKAELKKMEEALPKIQSLPDLGGYSNPEIAILIKRVKDVQFEGWRNALKEKGYGFVQIDEEGLNEVTEESSEISRERLHINASGNFWLTYNTILDEDGAIMEYESEAYSFDEFLKREE